MAIDSESRPADAPVIGRQLHTSGVAKSQVNDAEALSKQPARVGNSGYSQIDEIADKFRNHFVIPIVDSVTGTSQWTALVPGGIITDEQLSVDKLNEAIASKSQWETCDAILDSITVRAKIGHNGLLLSSSKAEEQPQDDASVHLDESGSSANVSLVVKPEGLLEVHKSCSHDGIDENGRPWLERQNRFLETSVAVRETDIFVKPLRHTDTKEKFSIDFPYLPSQTLAQLAMAGMGGDLVLGIASELIGEMAQAVWPKTATESPRDFIEKAHFDRIDRRVAIARAAVPELGGIVDSEQVVLNGRRLVGFHKVMEQLRNHPAIETISPTLIGEIHGDLNLHNILCCVGPMAQRPVALIDPRGVHLLSDFAKTRDFEPGDYAYELSKLKFSLSAFSEVRHGFLNLQGKGTEFKIRFDKHSGSETMRRADAGFFDALLSNDKFMDWIKLVEPSGFDALRKRVVLGEAANFVADAACALGRDTVHEVIPLFLIGLDKLNSVLAMLNDSIPEHKLEDWFSGGSEQSTTAGIIALQKSLLRPRSSASTWDVVELAVSSEQVAVANHLLETLRGKCYPADTTICASSSTISKLTFPCILVHSVHASASPSGAIRSGIAQADDFFERHGLTGIEISNLRIFSIQRGMPAAQKHNFARSGNHLFAPGPWGASPLELVLLTAQQLPFARGGRWFVDDSSCFVLSKELKGPAGSLCMLACPAAATGFSRPEQAAWREAVNSSKLLASSDGVPAGALFLSSSEANKLKGGDVETCGNLLTDIIFASRLDEESWTKLYLSLGFLQDPERAWSAAQKLAAAADGGLESISGGEKMKIHRFSSKEQYRSLMAQTKSDADLNSLAFMAATLAWREQWDAGVRGTIGG